MRKEGDDHDSKPPSLQSINTYLRKLLHRIKPPSLRIKSIQDINQRYFPIVSLPHKFKHNHYHSIMSFFWPPPGMYSRFRRPAVHMIHPASIPPRFPAQNLPNMQSPVRMPSFFAQNTAQLPGQDQQLSQRSGHFSDDEMFAIIRAMLGSEDENLANQTLQFDLQLGRIRDLGMNNGFIVIDRLLAAQMNIVKQQLQTRAGAGGPAAMSGQAQMSQATQPPGMAVFPSGFPGQNQGFGRNDQYPPVTPGFQYAGHNSGAREYSPAQGNSGGQVGQGGTFPSVNAGCPGF